jgi:hypothetical protein
LHIVLPLAACEPDRRVMSGSQNYHSLNKILQRSLGSLSFSIVVVAFQVSLREIGTVKGGWPCIYSSHANWTPIRNRMQRANPETPSIGKQLSVPKPRISGQLDTGVVNDV